MTFPGEGGPPLAGSELERVVRRWQQLPLDHALSASPTVRAVVQQLADDTAERTGAPLTQVPDLGPAVLMDQLRVMVFDARQAGMPEPGLAALLTAARRSLP